MRAKKSKLMTLWVVGLLLMPFVLIPYASAWTAGDEVAIFGHTFEEEYFLHTPAMVPKCSPPPPGASSALKKFDIYRLPLFCHSFGITYRCII